MSTYPRSKAHRKEKPTSAVRASLVDSGQEAKLSRAIQLWNQAPDPHPHHFLSTQMLNLKRFSFSLMHSNACQLINQEQELWPCSVTRVAQRVYHNSTNSPGRAAAHSSPLRQQAYLCRWSHFPRSLVCRCSCVPGQCWCRWHSRHSCAARCHIHHVLFVG